jgi:hypothetical protein
LFPARNRLIVDAEVFQVKDTGGEGFARARHTREDSRNKPVTVGGEKGIDTFGFATE